MNDNPQTPERDDLQAVGEQPVAEPVQFLVENHDRLMGRLGFREQRLAQEELAAFQTEGSEAGGNEAEPDAVPDCGFRWPGVPVEQAVSMSAVANEAAASLGADRQSAQDFVGVIERGLQKTAAQPVNDDGVAALHDQLTRQFGDRAPQLVEDARAAFGRMPERGKAWLSDALDRVPPATAAWVIHALAQYRRNAK